jgi:8-oxo-dGTP diphosphatase
MIKVTCAITRNDENKVLVVQHGEKSSHPFKWEFPGGKIKEGESEEECIIREINEELSIDIIIYRRMDPVEYSYGNKHILLIPFMCDTLDELPVLNEHIAFKWAEPGYLRNIDLLEADVIVAENYLRDIDYSEPGPEKNTVVTTDSENDDPEFIAMLNSTMGAKEVEWIAASAIENPLIFKKLFDYSISGDKKLSFHSSWALTKISDKNPGLLEAYIPYIIESLDKLENESTLRSFFRILSLSDIGKIDQRYHGILAESCFSALRSGFSAIAVKAYSMEIIYKLALIYPELAHELAASINMLHGEGPAGVIARGRMILKRLSQVSGD